MLQSAITVAEYSRKLKEEHYAKTAKNDHYDDAYYSSPFSASPQTSTAHHYQ
jgi:hypothetical protein